MGLLKHPKEHLEHLSNILVQQNWSETSKNCSSKIVQVAAHWAWKSSCRQVRPELFPSVIETWLGNRHRWENHRSKLRKIQQTITKGSSNCHISPCTCMMNPKEDYTVGYDMWALSCDQFPAWTPKSVVLTHPKDVRHLNQSSQGWKRNLRYVKLRTFHCVFSFAWLY
jgi:hypothetical protein